MRPIFDDYDVMCVALSKDSVAQAASHKRRDALSLTLLADPELAVIEQFGLLHYKALEFYTFNVLGIPLGFPRGNKTMAIPTTLLIDEEGRVLWIDMAEDYRVRGDEARIREALATHFDT